MESELQYTQYLASMRSYMAPVSYTHLTLPPKA